MTRSTVASVVGFVSTDELGWPVLGQHRLERRHVAATSALGGVVVLGPRSLFGHGRREPVDIDLDAAFGGDLLGELERKAVGVVKLKGDVASQRLPGLSSARCASRTR